MLGLSQLIELRDNGHYLVTIVSITTIILCAVQYPHIASHAAFAAVRVPHAKMKAGYNNNHAVKAGLHSSARTVM